VATEFGSEGQSLLKSTGNDKTKMPLWGHGPAKSLHRHQVFSPLQGSGRIPFPSLSTNSILFIVISSKNIAKKKAA
jgi:hypothetical protein